MIVGPSPFRARSTARSDALYISIGSLSSTRSPTIPYAGARKWFDATEVALSFGTEIPY